MSKDDKTDKADPGDDPAVGAETHVDEATEDQKAGESGGVTDTEQAGESGDTGAVREAESDGADEADTDTAEKSDADGADEAQAKPAKSKRRIDWARVTAFGLLPALALVLALGAGYLKWLDNSHRDGEIEDPPKPPYSLAEESVQTAKNTTIAILSYQPDTVEQQLVAARDLLTGEFRENYIALTNDVVIPGAQEKQIAAVASVPAAASVSATPTQAVVLVFVNQTVSVGQDPPTDTASSVRVTLDKVGDRWLISEFDPV